MVPVSRFNAIIRAAAQTALEREDELAAIYARAIRSAGRAYAAAFVEQGAVFASAAAAHAITRLASPGALAAAGEWTPPDALPELDPDLLEAARLKREQAAAALEQTLVERVAGLAISFDPATFKVFSPALLEPLAQHASEAFSAEMRDLTARAIRESFDAGLSVPDTAKAIRSVASAASKATATMLARTDLIGLANGGSFLTAKLVYAGEPAYKTWQNAHDARVRPSHVQAQGQTVPMDAPFRVGGFELMYPGDPQGPPGEVIQCRCTFTVDDSLVAPTEAPLVARSSEWVWADDETRFSLQTVEPRGQAAWESALSQAERQALLDYTGGSYQPMNRILRGEVVGEDVENLERIRNMDSALAKAPAYEEPITVWRGVSVQGYRQEQLREYVESRFPKGDTVELEGYQSSSFWTDPALDASLSSQNSGIILEIRANRGAYLGERLSKFDDEGEFVMPHDSRFRVVGSRDEVVFEKGDYGETVTRTVVQLEQI